MAKSPSHPAPAPPLFSFAVPSGAAAIEWALTLANAALLGCLPERFRTQRVVDRFITASRIVPVPQHELAAREHTDKPANAIQTFGLLLASGLTPERINELVYAIGPASRAYANTFLDRPTLFLDEQPYQTLFSPDPGEREHALCLLGTMVIASNLATAPQPRVLPQQPWQAVIHRSLEQQFLPSVRRFFDEAATYDEHRFAAFASQVTDLFHNDQVPQLVTAAASPSEEHVVRERINTMMNALFDDDQPVDAVDWEPLEHSRFVAHGTKVLFLLPGQVLPVFEFGTGVTLDRATRDVFARQAVLAFYDKLQQHAQLPVVAHHQRDLLNLATPLPSAYGEIGAGRSSILEHYLQSDLPLWYLDKLQRPWQRQADRGGATPLYPA